MLFRSIVKAFGKPVSQLVPETDVMPKLMEMPPTQRKLLFGILGQQAPDMADTIRALQFKSVLENAQAKAPSASAPTFVIDEALKQMNSKKGDFNFLFENPADAANASKAMQWMRQVIQGEQAQAAGGVSGSAAYMGTKAVGGTTQAANISRGFAQTLKDMLADPASFSKVIFDKDAVNAMIKAQQKTTMQSAMDAMTAIGKTALKTAVISPRLTSGVAPTNPQEQQQQAPEVPVGVSPADILEEMKLRGLQ